MSPLYQPLILIIHQLEAIVHVMTIGELVVLAVFVWVRLNKLGP